MISKGECLVEIAQLGMGKAQLLLGADQAFKRGEVNRAVALYGELLSKGREELRLTLEHNQHHLPPLDVPSMVGPIVNSLLMLADIKDGAADFDEADNLRQEALALAGQYLGEAANLDARRSQAAAHQARGKFHDALLALTEIRDRAAVSGLALPLIQATLSLVDILQWLGDLQRAAVVLETATKALQEPLASAPASDNALLGAFSDALAGGRYQAAQEMFQIRELSNQLGYYRGLIAMYLGRHAEARARFAEVLPAYEALGAGPAIQFHLAVMDVKEGDYVGGLAQLRALEPEFRGSTPIARRLGVLLRWQAEACLGAGEVATALRLAQAAAQALAPYHDPDATWRIHWLHGRCLARLNEPGTLKAYARAAELVADLRKAPLGYRLDSTYLRDKIGLFGEAIRLSCETGEPDRCLVFMELVKSRTLTATLSVPGATREDSLQGHRFDALSAAIDATEFAAYRAREWTPDLRARHDALVDERRDLMQRVQLADPRWRQMTERLPFDLASVRRTLAARGDAALALFRAGDVVVAVVVDAGGCLAELQPVTSETWSLLSRYCENLHSPEPSRALYDPVAAGIEASALVPSRLLDRALAAKRLVVIPHRELHLLPWAGLRHGGARLFERCAVGVLPNLSCITILAGEFATRPGLVLIGAPPDPGRGSRLDGAAEELAGLAEAHAAQVVAPAAVGPEATEAAFRELVALPRAAGAMLLAACHGAFDVADPMNSALLMADGRVDASEIARMTFRCDEVVLSACSTGMYALSVGDIELTGDDIMGLPGAFLEAGARSVLVSIPPANDLATVELMDFYCAQRMGGLPPLLALQAAQKRMTSTSYPAHQWIGFTAYGAQ